MPLSQVICVTHYTGFPFGSASFTELLCWYMALYYRLCPSLLAGTLSPCVDPGWASSASFLFRWQTLSSPCKHLDYAASCILSCCSFYLEFTSLADSAVTKELHAFAQSLLYKLLKTDFFTVVGLKAPLSSFLEG